MHDAACRTRSVGGGALYLAIFPSLICYRLFNHAVDIVGSVGSEEAGQTISLMPLFGALLAALILGEELSLYHLVGMLLITGGIGLADFLEGRREVNADAP